MNNQYDYFIVYKPYGMLCQFTSEGNKPALGSLYKFPLDCYPVGSLDTDSEGLLLLTNDKKVNQKFLDPKISNKRTYFAQVDGDISEEALKKLAAGMEIKAEGKSYKSLPAQVEKIEEPSLPPRIPPVRFRKTVPTSWISITLTESKNRQVKQMTAAVGFPTLRLVRAKMEKLELGNMQPNDVVKMKGEEVYEKLFS
jgi:23S rRNA pseudouridine2457 synthase